jgi:hypothetical protein
VVFVSDGARSGLRRFDSNSVTQYAATGAGLRRLALGERQTETHATDCGFAISGNS